MGNFRLRASLSGSIVLSRPKSFFAVYGGYVAAGVAVFTAQFVLIVGLLAQRARRRHAEQDSSARMPRDTEASWTRRAT